MLLCFTMQLFGQKVEVLDSDSFQLGEGVVLSKTSFRGLCVVNDEVVWVSGSRGTIARSIDGGRTFAFTQLKGYEKSDFRDIEAFDAKHAVIMSSGTPAYILKTTDGGKIWMEVYRNLDSAYFLDVMDFWDEKRGVIVGDPIDGRFVILETADGGNSWKQANASACPEAKSEEAVFAASGTSLRCWGKNSLVFVSGGSVSSMFFRGNDEHSWEKIPVPIVQGKSSLGAFSVTYPFTDSYNQQLFLIAGGNYLSDTLNTDYGETNFVVYRPKPQLWFRSKFLSQPNGYRSCIENIGGQRFVSCGTNGVDITMFMKEEGEIMKEWEWISRESFNVVRKAKKGKAVFLAGGKGRIAKLIY